MDVTREWLYLNKFLMESVKRKLPIMNLSDIEVLTKLQAHQRGN